MNINKTADECIVEIGIALLQCFVDPELTNEQKQEATLWINYFLDYQDAINNNDKTKITKYQRQLMKTFSPLYYKNALQEFKNANILYNNTYYLNKLRLIIPDYSTNETILSINTFSSAFITTIKKFNKFIKNYNKLVTEDFIANFQLLIYLIHYHITYLFKEEINETLKTLIKILNVKIDTNIIGNQKNKKQKLVFYILGENKFFFDKVEKINLVNFINHLEEIFIEGFEITKKMRNLVFTKPKTLYISMNSLLKKYNIKFYEEIWPNNIFDNKKSTILMHLMAYETYFVQGHGNNKHYEELILKNLNIDEKYWIVLNEFKKLNKFI